MACYLGIDTSNYTTSVARYDSDSGRMTGRRKLLPVEGEKTGLRQNEAVFLHNRQLPELLEELLCDGARPDAVSVSRAPRDCEGSYMPCFTVGHGYARALAAALCVPLFETSHQKGHVLAALYGADSLALLREPFLAFHVSGGTTELLHVTPDGDERIKISLLGGTLDLPAGQVIDRLGVSMGFSFPCGAQMEQYAIENPDGQTLRPLVTLRDGGFHLSGLENKAHEHLARGAGRTAVIQFLFDSIGESIRALTKQALSDMEVKKVVFAGGVMSNARIKALLGGDLPAVFTPSAYAADNAMGVALWGALNREELCKTKVRL
ncbi:peptidase M22 [Feifania hominis]|uniref:N(6)-L-threonylcarbamoyladenine synthase n=1 Tax=Feifania hominis TaxID=2763660 RepID=A0A926DEH2_9FIRM|nr:peptidase M22 [Feifania hominis]MBC8535545.1 peptidase M22 [Feifania hominis]